jgi:CBS domain-containing protein
MRTVRDVMSADVEVLRTTESVADAACYLAAHAVESIPLCQSDGSLAGTVSDHDIVAKVVAKGRDPREMRLAELAEPDGVLALDADQPVDVAASIMCRHHRERLPVVEGGRVVGLVTRRDIARSISFKPPWDDC